MEREKVQKLTYLALLEIFQKTNDKKVIDLSHLITEYAEKGRNCESEGLKFHKILLVGAEIVYCPTSLENLIKNYEFSYLILCVIFQIKKKKEKLLEFVPRSETH